MKSNFDPLQSNLPVTEIIPSVRAHLTNHNRLIISAPPGAGKSTLLPLALMNDLWLNGKKIILLEPRRLAARSIASRMSDLLNEPVGASIGYRIRFESKVSPTTRIEVVTEGILTRMLQGDNALEEAGMVIFDEFHERSIHADLALALCLEAQQVLRPDLRIVVMSATLDTGQLADLLETTVVESEGRMFPVEVIYTGEQDLQRLPEHCAATVIRALSEKEGDILVFLPGQAEIRKCEEILKRKIKTEVIHTLYGQLSQSEQQAAILPDPHQRRKIVLATSIAETSLTIEGVRIVVDSGYARIPSFDPGSGLSGLKTSAISLDSADQRAGRAGRLSEGSCYRMWSAATQQRMQPFRIPEISEADLTPMLLDLAKLGVSDIASLCWLTMPPTAAVSSAKEILENLNALNNGFITQHGKLLHELPCHPRLANMLIMAQDSGKLALATDIAAILEERDPLYNLTGVDINFRIEALRRYRRDKVSDRKWDRIEKVADSYRKYFKIPQNNNIPDHYATGLLLTYAYPERLAVARAGYPGQYQLANGKAAVLSDSDDLSSEQWLAIAQMDARKGTGKIFMAAPLNPEDLISMAKEVDAVYWDSRKGGLIASRDLRIGNITLQSKPLKNLSEERIIEAVSDAIKAEGESLLNFDEETEQWRNRVSSLAKWNPDDAWPDVSKGHLLRHNKEWLWPYLGQVKRVDELKKINLAQVLQQSLDYEKQTALERFAPGSISVPSGSIIKIKYSPDGESPVLAVRLQEVFGMLDTPRINNNKTPLVLHLLSPGFKPVQITTDLRSFWDKAYFEVRKELKRRYPKHSWPENPLLAEAVSGVRRKIANS
ncbi:ATP-dependent helicase HrpB [Desertivirga xinjiangensis]|uniref:ATP-dependent helicase HrpB n=1 Tax=Desertivirga xinjiangensis TaxID=539206 RepID=UPI00210BFF84|nr:ATP-dependent helicase HrpB [Pedobacter xinjiangensis]